MASGILCAPVFAGGGAGVVALANESILGANQAYWRLGADGFTYRNGAKSYAWSNPQSGMELFEIRATLASGDALNVNSGLGVWLAALTAPEWGYSNDGARAGSIDVQIRAIGGDGTILGAATIQLEVTTGTGGGLPSYPPSHQPYDREADDNR